ncbi:MAG TPA: LysM peptidoglycan-binding domain-containing protein [Caldilineaceae bacterium]|nr:LysM peptidoglycan-binding domain-containing protein [Caldilineaceae bacterium]
MQELIGINTTLPKPGPKTPLGNLRAARIIEVDAKGHYVSNGLIVNCLFNPFEYTISKSNSFTEQKASNGGDSPKADLTSAGPQTLKLNLIFDTTHEKEDTQRNVTLHTNELWKFMSVREAKANDKKANPQAKKEAPLVAFHWGIFYFVSYITSMSQTFIHFADDGTPLRAKVDVTFTQYADLDDYPPQNPTSGGGPINRTWQVAAGDRLDLIAAEVYQDATQWRRLADYNRLANPLNLQPGQLLQIPYEQRL